MAGALNGLLITRLRFPPLIVTLGTFSLFRGLAEGITGGVDNFTHFPGEFPVSRPGLLGGRRAGPVADLCRRGGRFWLLLHRTTIGRGLFAIGFSPDGARHAGLPVGRLVGLVYVLSGWSPALRP